MYSKDAVRKGGCIWWYEPSDDVLCRPLEYCSGNEAWYPGCAYVMKGGVHGGDWLSRSSALLLLPGDHLSKFLLDKTGGCPGYKEMSSFAEPSGEGRPFLFIDFE